MTEMLQYIMQISIYQVRCCNEWIFDSSWIEISCYGSRSIRKIFFICAWEQFCAYDIYNLLSHTCNLCCTNVLNLSITNLVKMTTKDKEIFFGIFDILILYYLIRRIDWMIFIFWSFFATVFYNAANLDIDKIITKPNIYQLPSYGWIMLHFSVFLFYYTTRYFHLHL